MLGEMRGVARIDELGAVRRCRSVVVHGRHRAPLSWSRVPIEVVRASLVCRLPSMPPVMPIMNTFRCWRLPR
jgi:hypothetical protein